MELEVLLFGAAANGAGSDRVRVTVDDAPTVRQVLAAMRSQHPALAFALPDADAGRLAVNQVFAGPEQRIQPGDEVALVTLVGGG